MESIEDLSKTSCKQGQVRKSGSTCTISCDTSENRGEFDDINGTPETGVSYPMEGIEDPSNTSCKQGQVRKSGSTCTISCGTSENRGEFDDINGTPETGVSYPMEGIEDLSKTSCKQEQVRKSGSTCTISCDTSENRGAFDDINGTPETEPKTMEETMPDHMSISSFPEIDSKLVIQTKLESLSYKTGAETTESFFLGGVFFVVLLLLYIYK